MSCVLCESRAHAPYVKGNSRDGGCVEGSILCYVDAPWQGFRCRVVVKAVEVGVLR